MKMTNLKKYLSLCLAMAMLLSCLPLPAQAADTDTAIANGTCGENITWTLSKDGILSISGTGEMTDPDSDYGLPWYEHREHIISAIIEDGITTIDADAFSRCVNLVTVSIPDSVTSIGDSAFYECISLASITIPDSVTTIGDWAFVRCTSLTSVTIPDSVTTIGDIAFHGCASLSSLTMGDGVTTIGDSAFEFCASLSSVTMGDSVTTIDERAFSACASLSSVTTIGEMAFALSPITSVTMGNGVVSIGARAFSGTDLTSVTIPDSVTAIGDGAFAQCFDLTSVTIPNSVTTIGEYAFHWCPSLTSVNIPDSVTTIGDWAFLRCDGLTEIRVDDNNSSYSSDTLGCLFDKNKTKLIQVPCALTGEYVIPDSVTAIGRCALSHCESVTKIQIPASVSCIEGFAFARSLAEVYFYGDAPTIGDGCFRSVNATVYYPSDNITWTSAVRQNYGGELTWIAADIPNSYGFSLRKDGWCFANAAESFAEEPISHAKDYFIPKERYDALFGKAYVDATEGLYTEKWGGNCAGMSATSILFFLDSLDWARIDAEYAENFSNPNDFYRTVNLHNKSQSNYPAIGNDTEVTRLIEAYQLYINAIDKSSLVGNLENTYFEEDIEEKSKLFGKNYVVNHISSSNGGTYIAAMLDEFQDACNDNKPLLIVLQADGFGHGIVSRTDLKPKDMGDGWWRVYVYDPNKPYINETVCSIVSGVEVDPKYTFGCNTLVDNGGDTFIELNPSLNQWRYCTSVNSNGTDSYIGSSPSGELLWKTYYHDATPENENDDGSKKHNAKLPEYFYTIDLTELSMEDFGNPHFDSTSSWMPENDLAIAVDGNTDCSVYTSAGELIAIVEDGDAFVLSDAGSYDGYIGQAEDGSSLGGKLYLPDDVYTVYYTSGSAQFLGNDNVLSFSCKGAAKLTVDIAQNSMQVVAQEDGVATVKCANVTSADECSYVRTEGALAAGETFSIKYSDDNKVEASTDSKNGEFQLYQKKTNQEEATATEIVKSSDLRWLWVVGGVIVIIALALFIVIKKKHNA